MENKSLSKIEIILWIIFVLVMIFEIGYWIYVYTYSDEIECNFIWCSFKTTTLTKTIEYNNSFNQYCFINGEEVNCTDVEEYTP